MPGRHRKPTTSSFHVAKIAVTGAVLSGGSIGLAAAAQAATDSEWDTVAACESSGNWSINTGNGYHGGLQFSPSTWLGYGGGQFASSAHQASREQQIAIAEKVLAGQGRGAWPVCGRGLSGPSQRNVATTATKAHSEAPAAPAETPAEAALPDLPAPLDMVIPVDLPVQAELPPPVDLPVPVDMPIPAEVPGVIEIAATDSAPELIATIDTAAFTPTEAGVPHLASQRIS